MTDPEPVTAIEKAPATVEIIAPLDLDKLKSAFAKFQAFKESLLTPDDYVQIGNKTYLKKSAWRKWSLACSVSDRLISLERVPAHGLDDKGHFYYRVIVEAYHQATNRTASGLAIASSSEKPKWAHIEHDCLTLAHTRAKNRAISDLVGGGEVSAEEMEPQAQPSSTPQPQTKAPVVWRDVSGPKP